MPARVLAAADAFAGYEKLGVSSRAAAALFAERNDLVRGSAQKMG